MAFRTLTIECPMCKGTITVDAETGKVLEHKEYKKEQTSFEDFLKQQKNRDSDLNAKFAAAMEEEKNRKELLEKKFAAAKKDKDLKDPPPSVLWD